jgi:hypothetical protein
MDALLRSGGRMEHHAAIRPLAERYRHFGIAETVYRQLYGSPGQEALAPPDAEPGESGP